MSTAKGYKFGRAAAIKEVKQLLTTDKKWHRDNPGTSGCGESFENGFITGLAQAQRLVRKVGKAKQ